MHVCIYLCIYGCVYVIIDISVSFELSLFCPYYGDASIHQLRYDVMIL